MSSSGPPDYPDSKRESDLSGSGPLPRLVSSSVRDSLSSPSVGPHWTSGSSRLRTTGTPSTLKYPSGRILTRGLLLIGSPDRHVDCDVPPVCYLSYTPRTLFPGGRGRVNVKRTPVFMSLFPLKNSEPPHLSSIQHPQRRTWGSLVFLCTLTYPSRT